jgi:hypothetical protein
MKALKSRLHDAKTDVCDVVIAILVTLVIYSQSIPGTIIYGKKLRDVNRYWLCCKQERRAIEDDS